MLGPVHVVFLLNTYHFLSAKFSQVVIILITGGKVTYNCQITVIQHLLPWFAKPAHKNVRKLPTFILGGFTGLAYGSVFSQEVGDPSMEMGTPCIVGQSIVG